MNENQDDPQDFETTADAGFDNEFSEFDQDEEGSSLSDVIKRNPLIKIGLVVAALIVVIGGVAMFGGSDKKTPDSVVAGTSDSLKSVPGSQELTPAMKEVVQEVNDQRLEQAEKTGGSVIPTPTETPKASLQAPAEETPTEDPLLRWKVIQEQRLKTQQQEQNTQQPEVDQAKNQARQALVTAMTGQMNQILTEKKPIEIKSMTVTDLRQLLADRAQQQQTNGGAGTTANVNNTTNPNQPLLDANGMPIQLDANGMPIQPKILLPAGAIEYGQLLIEANSDVVGPVVAMVVSGPFAGSRVLGSFQTTEELLVLQFNTLVNKKGVSIPITAYALDPNTTLTGMATDVDHRYWERIILPAAAEFVTGMAQAYADRQGQTTVVTGDTVVQDQPPLDVQEQVAKGIENAGDKVGEILDQEGQSTKPLVRVRAGTPLGILFLAAVTDQDFTIGQNSPETARSIALQRQQQAMMQQNNQNNQNPLYLIQGLQNAQGLQTGQAGPYGTGTGGYGTTGYGTYGTQPTGTTTNTANSSNGSTLPRNIFSTQQYLNNQ